MPLDGRAGLHLGLLLLVVPAQYFITSYIPTDEAYKKFCEFASEYRISKKIETSTDCIQVARMKLIQPRFGSVKPVICGH